MGLDGVTRLLLRVFPARFRADHLQELEEAYRDLHRAGRRPRRLAVWWDLLRNGLATRLEEAADRRRRPEHPGRGPGRSLRSRRPVASAGRWEALRRPVPSPGLASTSTNPTPAPHRRRQAPRWSDVMQSVLQDLGYAVRMLRSAPGFAAVVVLSLAFGIGVNSAAFSLVDAALLRDLPVRDPERLVTLGWSFPGEIRDLPDVSLSGWLLSGDDTAVSSSFSYPYFEALRDGGGVFAEVVAMVPADRLTAVVDGAAEVADGQAVSGNYFRALGLEAAVGRVLVAGDDRPDADTVAVISHEYWRTRFGADPGVVGRQLRLNGVPTTIVGVSPEGFHGTLQVGERPSFTLPLAAVRRLREGTAERFADGGYWWLHLMARLAPGADAGRAQAVAEARFQATAGEALDWRDGVLPSLELRDGSGGLTEERDQVRGQLLVLAGICVLVLLIACANVANFLLARAGTRRREMAVRSSLGAGRPRLVGQMLTESLMLAAMAGLAALGVALWARGLLGQLVVAEGLDLDLRLDLRVLAFTAVVAGLSGLLFGTLPALRSSRSYASAARGDDVPPVRVGRLRLTLPRALLAVQVAVSLVLLVSAGLLVRTLLNLQADATGFDADNVLVFRIDPSLSGLVGGEAVRRYDELTRRLEALPEVVSAAVARHTPVSDRITMSTLQMPGYDAAEDESTFAFVNLVTPGFFETLRIPELLGRGIEAGDVEGRPEVAVVNRALVDRYFGGDNPVGRRIGLGRESAPDELLIVGVVENVKYQQLRDPMYPAVHVPLAQHPGNTGGVMVALRTRDDPLRSAPAVREVVADVMPGTPVADLRTQRQQQRQTLLNDLVFARLATILGITAALLVCIGLHGLLSHSVLSRRREIGVRIALGADGRHVGALVVRQLAPVVVGLGLGLGGAVAGRRILASRVYGLSPTDPWTLAGAAAILLAVALFAAWLPARRAARVDPVLVLR